MCRRRGVGERFVGPCCGQVLIAVGADTRPDLQVSLGVRNDVPNVVPNLVRNVVPE